jgi:transposase
VIDAILEEDKQRPRKQRHTAKRIFERLRAEHSYMGGYTIVKDYVRSSKIGGQEMFVPLTHAPGEAQADFGEAMVVIAGVEQKAHFMAFDLPLSDDCFVQAFPAETTEAFLEGHVRAFAYFDGVPTRILYDNTTLAVARILGDGERQKTRAFSELQSYYLFAEKFGRPAKGNDKGKVENLVGYARRNFMVPIPHASDWEELNSDFEADCRQRRQRRLRGHRVRFTTASALVSELIEARDDKHLLRFQKQLASYELLIVDELGFVPLSKTGAELLFETFSQRYERASTLVTSNLPFEEWTEIFGSERLSGALLDRLTHHVHILEMNGDSFRLKHSRRKRNPPSER